MATSAPARELQTPHGPARAHVHRADDAVGTIILGHGAGGGVDSPDLRAAVRAAVAAGFSAVLVEQPYRVAGRRSPAPAKQLDDAWIAVVEQLRSASFAGPLVAGGRSSGARVACRTAAELGVEGVLCLAFPLHPPGKAGDPSKSRLGELDAVSVPVLVVQGEADPFGRPPPGQRRSVVVVAGTHALKRTEEIERAIGGWLPGLL
jgi:predicted alpha/beta-hydrolase family hydrolase